MLGATLLCVGKLQAHTKSESYEVWTINGPQANLTFTVSEKEVLPLASNGNPLPTAEDVSSYLSKHLSVSSNGIACGQTSVQAVSAKPGFRRFEFAYLCPDGRGLTLHSSAFFELVPTHITFARIRNEGAEFVEELINKDHQEIAISEEANGHELQNAGFIEYVRLGVMHILTGPDHIAFLIGLVLISRTFRDLAFVITGFTLGHSVTLGLAVMGVVRPETAYIDTLIGLTIALIGAENVVVAVRRPIPLVAGTCALFLGVSIARYAGFGLLPIYMLVGLGMFSVCYLLISTQLRDGAWVRLVVTMTFGLIHGFAFANDLIEMNLPTGRMAELLLGFNLGVEAGQLLLVSLMLLVTAFMRRLHLAVPRAQTVDLLSAGLVGFGLFLLTSRIFA